MIDYVHYHNDGHKGYLGVIFKSGDGYIYDNVNLSSIIEMLKSESVGSFFSKNITKKYPYKNVGNTDGQSPLSKIGIII